MPKISKKLAIVPERTKLELLTQMAIKEKYLI
jgi:hypothetical protein